MEPVQNPEFTPPICIPAAQIWCHFWMKHIWFLDSHLVLQKTKMYLMKLTILRKHQHFDKNIQVFQIPRKIFKQDRQLLECFGQNMKTAILLLLTTVYQLPHLNRTNCTTVP